MSQKLLGSKKILLGITGGIAAYKSAELVRLLKKSAFEVRVVMTSGASHFMTPLTLQTLSGHQVYQTLADAENETTISHINLARWADLILIAPATAHLIAKLSAGLADDLLTTLCLATATPIAIAPAMNSQMWFHPATQANLYQLIQRNIRVLGPGKGAQACGETGEGRMLEPEEIVQEIERCFQLSQRLQNKRVVVTAGPTQEAIDPVRYISNYSSGKMGYAIAQAAAQAGAQVTLVSGPTALAVPNGVKRIEVISAQQMFDAVMAEIKSCDLFISTAAVSDYRIKEVYPHKLKKSAEFLRLELTLNPDILAVVSRLRPRPFLVGFAAETENLLENAKKKLQEKQLDVIVANWVGAGKGFQEDENELFVITSNNIQTLPHASKKQLARALIEVLSQQLTEEKAKMSASGFSSFIGRTK